MVGGNYSVLQQRDVLKCLHSSNKPLESLHRCSALGMSVREQTLWVLLLAQLLCFGYQIKGVKMHCVKTICSINGKM